MTRKFQNVNSLNRISGILSVLLTTAVLVSGCSKKTTITSSVEYKRDELNIEELNFDYLSIKSKILFQEAGNEKNATALMRIKKDSVIWFNLSGTLGVQGIRGIMTTDSLRMINRVEKQYYALSYADLSEEFNFKIDFFLIQAMLLGNMPKGMQEEEKITRIDENFIIHQKFGDFYIDNYISASTRRVTEVNILETATQNSLTLMYGQFQEIDGYQFPHKNFISLIHKSEFGELETRMNIDHKRVVFTDKPLKFPFTVPKKYAQK